MKNKPTADGIVVQILAIIESKLKEVPHQVALKTKGIKEKGIVEDIISREIQKCFADSERNIIATCYDQTKATHG